MGSILYYIAVLYTLQYLYAFSMSPMASMDPKELTQQPPAATNYGAPLIIIERDHFGYSSGIIAKCDHLGCSFNNMQ